MRTALSKQFLKTFSNLIRKLFLNISAGQNTILSEPTERVLIMYIVYITLWQLPNYQKPES